VLFLKTPQCTSITIGFSAVTLNLSDLKADVLLIYSAKKLGAG
jgi:hypothetical protein